MTRKYTLVIVLIALLQCTYAQITFRGCVGVMGAQDFILTATGTNTDDGITRNIYESTPLNFAQSCPSGVCEMQIIWNTTADRWEMKFDNDGPINTPDYTTANLYYSTAATYPNPPDISFGNWQNAGFCPDGITTMSGDVNDGATLGVDVFETEPQIRIYPNPANKVLKIQTKKELKDITIYSVLGKSVFKIKTKTIDVSKLAMGMYLIKITDIDGRIIARRFIKE